MAEPEKAPKTPRFRRYEIALVVAIALLAAVIRIWGLGAKSFWIDEISTVDRSRILRQAIVECRFGHEPPLRYIITHHLARLAPPELYTRLPSFLLGVATIPFFWFLARMLFGAATALVATVLLALSHWHILHCQDMRMYSVMMFFWVISLVLLFRIFDKPDHPWAALNWAGLAVIHAVNFYLSYLTLFMLVSEAVVLIGVVFVRWRKQRPRFDPRPYAVGLLVFAGCFAFFLAFWVQPMLDLLDRYLGTNLSMVKPMITAVRSTPWEGWPAQLGPEFFVKLFDRLLLPGFWWRLPAVALCPIGLGIVWKTNRPFVWIAILSFVIPVLMFLFTDMRHFVAVRYVFHLLIFSTLAIAVAVVTAAEKLAEKAGGGSNRLAVPSMLALLLAVYAFLAAPTVWLNMACERQDWRGACRYLAEHVRKPQPARISDEGEILEEEVPGDLIITGPWMTHLAVKYYAPDELSSTTIRNCLSAELTEAEILEAEERVWFITWGHQPETLRLVIRSFLEPEPVASIPGLKGTIEIYRPRLKDTDE